MGVEMPVNGFAAVTYHLKKTPTMKITVGVEKY